MENFQLKAPVCIDLADQKKALDEVSMSRLYVMACQSLDPESFSDFIRVAKILCEVRGLDASSKIVSGH